MAPGEFTASAPSFEMVEGVILSYLMIPSLATRGATATFSAVKIPPQM